MSVPLHLILVAAGSSRRFGHGDKLLADLNGAPVFIHSLRRLLPAVTGRSVIVVPRGRVMEFENAALPFVRDLDLIWCEGGASRSDSVRNGVAALGAGAEGIAAVHDGARPLADAGLLRKLYEAALSCDGSIPGKPVADTLWKSDGTFLDSLIEREGLWAVETPQLFKLGSWKKAVAEFPESDFTDDAGLLRSAGFRVAMVLNPDPNIKLTTPADLTTIRAML